MIKRAITWGASTWQLLPGSCGRCVCGYCMVVCLTVHSRRPFLGSCNTTCMQHVTTAEVSAAWAKVAKDYVIIGEVGGLVHQVSQGGMHGLTSSVCCVH